MADEESELIRDIAETRNHLEKNLETLETRLRRSVDVRDRIRKRPWTAVGSALGAGFAVGLMRRPARPARARAGEELLREIGLIVLSGLVRDLLRTAAPQIATSLSHRLRGTGASDLKPASRPPAPGERTTTLFERTRAAREERLRQQEAL